MSASSDSVQSFVIPINTAVSNWLPINTIRDAEALLIYGPTTLDAHTFTLQVTYIAAPDITAPVAAEIFDWYDGVANVVGPAAGQAVIYPLAGGFSGIRIKDASGNVAAARTFKVRKIFSGIGA